MEDELALIQPFRLVAPHPEAEARLRAVGTDRRLSLSELRAPKGLCVWCRTTLAGRKQRWCSEGCVFSATLRCYPQDPAPKIHRLIWVQNFACVLCGQSFEDKIRGMIREKHARAVKWNRRHPTMPQEPKVSLYQLGYGTGDLWQTDHKVPIHAGGLGIDPENLQVLCVPCHKAKTAREVPRGTDR